MYIVDENDKKLVNYLKELLIKGDLESIISIRHAFCWSKEYLGEIIQDFINENSKIEEEPIEIKEDKEEDFLVLQRDVVGGRLLDGKTGETIKTFTEVSWRDKNFSDGDKVILLSGDYLISETGNSEEDSRLVNPSWGIVEKSLLDDSFSVSRLVSGETLESVNKSVPVYKIPKAFSEARKIEDGDLLDLAWDKSNPSKIMIRRTYKTEDASDTSNKDTKAETTPKVKKVKDKKVKEYIPSTSLDLTDKKIAVVVGDEIRSEYILPMIESLGGKGIMIDAFKRVADESYMTSSLEGVDVAVVIKNYQKHATSWLVKTVCSKLTIPMGVSNSAGLSSIERAIWRAVNGKSAEESSYLGSYT